MRATAVVLIGVFAASCASTPVPSPAAQTPEPSRPPAAIASDQTPTVTVPSRPPPSTTAGPTIRPSPASTPAEAHVAPRPDSFAYVITDDLRVRSKPEVSDESVKYEPLLWKGALAWVVAGPVRGSGYDWFRIDPMGEADLQYHPDPPPEGWVAASSKDGEPWIAGSGSCDAKLTPLDTVSDFDWPPQGLIGLSCFGNRTLEFAGMAARWKFECEAGDAQLDLEPAWFRQCGYRYVLDVEGGFPPWERAPLLITLAPEADVDVDPTIETGAWVKVRVTGHYDDPRARDCRQRPGGSVSEDAPLEHAVRTCRSRFVVIRMVG
jgi:hypothetical protein